MKTAIRRGVFETNSSSTHSLTYSAREPDSYAFACESAWSRLLLLKGLLNEAALSGKDKKRRMQKFFTVCRKVFSERENIPQKKILDYLGEKMAELYKKDDERGDKEEFLCYFREAFDKKGDYLCSFLFENGCLISCDCGYCRFGDLEVALLSDGEDETAAEKYLYGEKMFFAKESYAGCCPLEDKMKY